MTSQPITIVQREESALPASAWGAILGITPRAVRKRLGSSTRMELVQGILSPVYIYSDLPDEYRMQIGALVERHSAPSVESLLVIRGNQLRRAWQPSKPWTSHPASARERALKRKDALALYWHAIERGDSVTAAKALARQRWEELLGEACTERTIRRWVRTIEDRGGPDFAPAAAYLDGKSADHPRQRNTYKLSIPEEFLTSFAARCVQPGIQHIRAAYRSLTLDWMAGREVPGLGTRGQADAPKLPWTFAQLRAHAPGTAARKLGGLGKAIARRDAMPFVHTTTASLRRCELLLLDDTRVDVIAARDSDGFPVELKSYILMDVASRQILGYIVKEESALLAEDVWALLARVLAQAGLPIGHQLHIKFERGAVACSTAAESLLTSLWPGRIRVHRTSVNGGRTPGGFVEQSSGNWMGKAHIESFMRTFAYSLEHVAGQRGGDYRRQPAPLGLQGKDRATGMLRYTRGSQLAEGTKTEVADRILRWLDSGSLDGGDRQLRIETGNGRHLLPVRWVRDAILGAVAAYNQTTEHRMEGFARIEYQDQQTGALKWRMESPDERATWLESKSPTERISDADAAALLQWRGRTVTVRSNGVSLDCAPWRGMRFFSPDSKVIHEVSRLATCERRLVGLIDPEQLAEWRPGCGWTPMIHLLGDIKPDAWRPGDPGRYLESLPLVDAADLTDPDALAAEHERISRATSRVKSELIYASRNVLADEIAGQRDQRNKLDGAIALIKRGAIEAASSDLAAALALAPSETRHGQRAEAAPDYHRSLGTADDFERSINSEH